jgi:hypothetical protein
MSPLVPTSVARRFPAPWTVERIPGGYVVKDATGQPKERSVEKDGGKRGATWEYSADSPPWILGDQWAP